MLVMAKESDPSIKGGTLKSLTSFLQMVLLDLESWCCTSTARDLKTITSRVEHEGLSFLTITLPNFGKDFEKSLDQGYVSSDEFAGFQRSRGLPAFLQGFLRNVFDFNTGRLLDVPDITSIWAVRQLTLMFGKMSDVCTDVRIRAAISDYVECESDVRKFDVDFSYLQDGFKKMSNLLWSDVFQRVDEDIYYGRIIPLHGPGSVADSLTSNGKWNNTAWTERLEQLFPHMEVLCPSWSLSLDRLSTVVVSEPGAELPVRVITVPKTLKTPRIIAVEPTCMMFVQQGLLRSILDAVEGLDIPSRLISWQSQVPNQVLARKGSLSGEYATLDLSSASDRVSNQHVRAMLANFPHLFEAVDACRSRKADVPGHGVIRLAKFASMGSALCFPFEAMIFTTVVFLGIQSELRRPITRRDISSLAGEVRVYGDDIIVPRRFVRAVTEALENFGFRVNSSKSFWTGKFRESCGRDYYSGVDVSVTRLRSGFPTSRRCVREIVSTLSTRNQLYQAGLWRSAHYLDTILGRFIPLPYVSETSPLLGRFSFLGVEQPSGRLHPDYQYPVVKGAIVAAVSPVDRLDDYGALQKCLTLLEVKTQVKGLPLPGQTVSHLERAGRPRIADIKTRWLSPV